MTEATDPNERRIREQAEELRRIGADLKESMSRAARTFETLGELHAARPEGAAPAGRPRPSERKVLLLTCCMNTFDVQEGCKREGFEPCIYISGSVIGKQIPFPIRAITDRINVHLGHFPQAEYLCADVEDAIDKQLAHNRAAALHFHLDQLIRQAQRVSEKLEHIGFWGLPEYPWWAPDETPIHTAPGSVIAEIDASILQVAEPILSLARVTCLLPGMYTRHRGKPVNQDIWSWRVGKKIGLCHQIAPSKPVYPCLCPFDQHNFNLDEEQGGGPPLYGLTAKDLLTPDEWKDVLKHVASFQPAGASMWCVKEWWEMTGVPDDALRVTLDLMEKILLR